MHLRLKQWSLAVALLAVSTTAFAESRKGDQPVNEVAATLSTFQGAIDPATGRLRELTPEEAADLSRALGKLLNRSMEGVKVTANSDGSLEADLDGRFMNVVMARVNEDGTVERMCVEEDHAGFAFMTHKTPPASKAETQKPQQPVRSQRETE
ncbi:MAG TPA: hypothetical protein VF618_09755 [Thermoanaerobaculia bacterium]